MTPKHKIYTFAFVLVLSFLTISSNLNAQVFSGIAAFKNIIEYEGQRFLMDEVYKITSTDFDKMKISKTITETDYTEGFMFVLTSYTFNGKSGVVITSFNSTNFQNSQLRFTNIHLTHLEYSDLVNAFESLAKNDTKADEHLLNRFNDRLILDVNNEAGSVYYTLWVDNYSRHTFMTTKWDRAFNLYNKFITD